jgi:hypothetical protein
MNATFFYIQNINGKFQKTIVTAPIIESFNGGYLVGGINFPNGKCIANENIIAVN